VLESQTYRVEVYDRATDVARPMVDLFLEADVNVLLPNQAYLWGAPRQWLNNSRPAAASSQPAQSIEPLIPFDKCTAVLEYDSRKGSAPSSQGWTFTGTGSALHYGFEEGPSLRFITTASLTSYWEKALALSTNPGRIHAYATHMRGSYGAANGFELQGLYGTSGQPYRGIRIGARDAGLIGMTLAGGSPSVVDPDLNNGWNDMGAAEANTSASPIWTDSDYTTYSTFGTTGTAGATEVRARFGDVVGGGIAGWVRNVVVSAPGRFVRARFVAHAENDTPLLRLALSRVAAVGTYTARFLVRYGQPANPAYELPLVASFTVTIPVANQVLEFPLQLPGLIPRRMFWMDIERDWTHAEDAFDDTIHLHYATVRPR
jgi:hypothetical protein